MFRSISRRDTIKACANAYAAVSIGPKAFETLYQANSREPDPYLNSRVPDIRSDFVREMLFAGVAAARNAGADYADVRATHLFHRRISGSDSFGWMDTESVTIGIRALKGGYWGFSSGCVWGVADADKLAIRAVDLAAVNAAEGLGREVHLQPKQVFVDEHWENPMDLDPFEVSREEISDYFISLRRFSLTLPDWRMPSPWLGVFNKTRKAFADTDGSYLTQVITNSAGGMSWMLQGKSGSTMSAGLDTQMILSTDGWERFRNPSIRDSIREIHAELKEDVSYPIKPVEVGRYDAVMDSGMVSTMVSSSAGVAAQLDRALGFEANAGGTSYLKDVEGMPGSYRLAPASVSIKAGRSRTGDAATVKWDDEGMAVSDFHIIKDGVFTNYITTRESSSWIKSSESGRSSVACGTSSAPEAVDLPMSHTPNLEMQPGSSNATFKTMVESIDSGIAVKRGNFAMDFQQLNGSGHGTFFEVKNGKRTSLLVGAMILNRAPEFWSSISSIGGADSLTRHVDFSAKGEPQQRVPHSVWAVPVTAGQISVIDSQRKG